MNNILTLITCIIELYICYEFFCAFLEKKTIFTTTHNTCIVFILICLFHFLINSFKLSFLNLVALPLILLCFTSIVFYGTVKKKLLYITFICSIFWGCEFLFMILLDLPSFIMKKNSIIDLTAIPWHLFTLLLLKYVVCNIFKQLSKKSHTHLDNKIFLYYLCIPIASIGIMFLTYYAGIDFSTNSYTKILLCIYFAIMQLGNILIFYAFQKYSDELYRNIQQNLIITDQKMKLDYYTQIQSLDNKYSEFIHNTSHYIKAIGTLISDDNNEAALNIINDLNVELEANSTSLYSTNKVLNSILSEKKSIADKQNIDMDIYVEPGTHFTPMSDMDLITILSNLIDNAIEASKKCNNDRFICIRIYMHNQGNMCIAKITNSFNGKLIKFNDDFVSTKKECGIHGVGLKSVRNTAERNGGYVECYDEDDHFVAVLLLPVNEIAQ